MPHRRADNMRQGNRSPLLAGLVLAGAACVGPSGPAPQDFDGTFAWQVPGTHTRGTLTLHPDAESVVPDTLTTSAGDVIECEAISSCPLRCGPICFQVTGGRLRGLLDRCAEHDLPVRRRLRDPRTGRTQVVKEIVTRTECREEPVWVDDAPLPADSA